MKTKNLSEQLAALPKKVNDLCLKLKKLSTTVTTLTSSIVNYFTVITPDAYIGTRLSPLTIYNGFEINKSVNGAIGYRSVNNDDVGNGALSGFTAKGAGALYVNSTALIHFGASYFIPYFAGNGAVSSNKKLLLGTTGGSDLELYTGTASSNVTPKLIVKNNGQIEIPVQPTLNNTAVELIGRLTDGKIVTVTKPAVNRKAVFQVDQSGIVDPTLSIISNTSGETFLATRIAVGVYRIKPSVSNSGLALMQIVSQYPNSAPSGNYPVFNSPSAGPNGFFINCRNSSTGALTDMSTFGTILISCIYEFFD